MDIIKKKLARAFQYFNKGQLKQAEILYLECLDKIEDQLSKQYKQALHGLGIVKSELGNYQLASELYMQLLAIAKQEINKQEEAIVYHQLGMVKRMAGDCTSALDYFTKEQMIYKEHDPDFHLGFAANLYEQGMICMNQGKLKEAAKRMTESLQHAKQTDDLIVLGCAYRGLGDIAKTAGNLDTAKEHFHLARQAFQEAKDTRAVLGVEERMNNL